MNVQTSMRTAEAARRGPPSWVLLVISLAAGGGVAALAWGARPGGDEVRERVMTPAEAVAVGDVEKPAAAAPAGEPPAVPAVQVCTGIVDGVGSLGDGRLKVDGVTIYVPGTAKGDRIVFEIVRKGDRFGSGRLVEKLAADASPAAPVAPAEIKAPASTVTNAAPADAAGGPPKEGEERVVTITEKARRNPDTDGVVRLGGMVVIVPGTQPGQTVKLRITSVRERVAFAEVVPDAGAAPAAPSPQ
jgi:predicted RNA-binding protein with TRAM domain